MVLLARVLEYHGGDDGLRWALKVWLEEKVEKVEKVEKEQQVE